MAPRKGKRPYVAPNAARVRAAAGLTAPRDLNSYPNLSPLFGQGHGFSMRDEVKNTMSHQSAWGQDARLRAKPVAFVSTGFTEPLKDLKVDEESNVIMGENAASEHEVDTGEASFRDTATEPHLTSVQLVEASVEVEIEQETSTPALEIPTEVEVPAVVDKIHGPPANPNDSPCDVTPGFFFDLGGDKSLHQVRSPVIIPTRASSPARSDSSEEVILFRGRSGQTQRSTAHTPQRVEPTDIPANPSKPEFHQEYLAPGNSSAHPGQSASTSKARRKRSSSAHRAVQNRRVPEVVEEDDEEDQILADYIANMAAQSEDDMIPQLLKSFNNRRDLGGDDDAFDFGFEDGDERGPGKGFTKDDADEALDDDDDDDEQDDAGDTSDNDTPSGLNDESLARLLAKQEELGMGADELLLFSEAFAKMRSPSRGRDGNQSSKKARLNTGAVADALDNLDLTDWNQEGFSKPGRARRSKQPPAFDVSDSELEMALKTAWLTDRERKKNRKMERELLRSQGLLGKNVDPDDLRVKYQSHMTLDDMKSELVAFLIDSAETIQFPPMDKEARKALHMMARNLKIKSQSTGKGDQRRTVLYRTKNTIKYTRSGIREATNHVEQVSMTTKRQYFQRLDKKGPATLRGSGAKRSGHKAVTYREGEVVGASAQKLGQENKGHAMLEKMGWSRGMALGALENKGILEPIAQIVKQSKAGLG